MHTFIKLAAAAIIAVVPATLAHAQTSGARTQSVQFADLDLSSAAGQKTLKVRIALAVRNVCDQNVAPMDLQAIHVIETCRKAATAKALASVHSQTTPSFAARNSANVKPSLGQ